MEASKPYFEEGGSMDGCFAGYGAGWYFERNGHEFGPYDSEEAAIKAEQVLFERD